MNPNQTQTGVVRSHIHTSDKIPANGTKPIDTMSKAAFANSNYTIAPAYNKGAYQVVSKDEIKYMGKK